MASPACRQLFVNSDRFVKQISENFTKRWQGGEIFLAKSVA